MLVRQLALWDLNWIFPCRGGNTLKSTGSISVGGSLPSHLPILTPPPSSPQFLYFPYSFLPFLYYYSPPLHPLVPISILPSYHPLSLSYSSYSPFSHSNFPHPLPTISPPPSAFTPPSIFSHPLTSALIPVLSFLTPIPPRHTHLVASPLNHPS
jgi:hypothetical protein